MSRPTSPRAGRAQRVLCTGVMGFMLATPAWAAVTLTVDRGVSNPPASVNSGGVFNPEQTAVAYTASVVTEASVNTALQWTLNQQGFTAGNNWTLNTATVTLNNNDTFNLNRYSLAYTGTAPNNGFKERVDFTLRNPTVANNQQTAANLYNGVPNGATVHWVQLLVESYRVNNFGYYGGAGGTPPVFKLDNGSGVGGLASGPATGPYYDSNAGGKKYSTPPNMYDGPGNYRGAGFYFQAFSFPTWDVFTAAGNGKPATETIDIGNYGVSWGFYITGAANPPVGGGNVPLPASPVPETSTTLAGSLMLGFTAILLFRSRRKSTALTLG